MARSIKVALELDNKQFNRAIKSSDNQVDQFEKNSTSSFSKIGAGLAAIGGGVALKGVIETKAAFQDLQNSLNVVFGGIQQGESAFQRVQDFAATTQFSVQQLTQAFVQLKGAGVEPTEQLLQTFADTASVTTDQMGTFQAALDLVSRSTAGGLGLEDLNRLADRGIPVFQILQDRLGLARLEISEFGKTSQGANTLVRELIAGLNERFGGALANQVGLINFELNQLGDALDKVKVALFDALLGNDATSGITNLTASLNKLADNMGNLVDILKILGAGFIAVRLAAVNVSRIFISLFDKTKALLTGTGLLAKNFATLKNAVQLLGRGIAGLGFRGMIAAIIAATGAFAPYIAAALAAGYALFELAKFMGFFTDANEKMAEPLKNNAHVLAFQAEQERLAAVEAAELAKKTKDAADAAEAFQRGYDEASKSIEKFKKEAIDSNDPLASYMQFFSDLLKETNDYLKTQENATIALRNVKQMYEDGFISLEAYTLMSEKLNDILGIQKDKVPTEAFENFNDIVEDISKSTTNYNLLLETLTNLLANGKINAEQFAEAKANLDQAFTENEGLNNFLETLGSAQKALSEDLATAFLEGENAGTAFKDFFKKMIQSIIADIIRLSIIQPILGAILAPFGFGFGVGGNVMKLPGKASGGPVMPGGAYLVGEKGPEVLQMGSQAGNIIPNNRLGGGATAVTYNINAVDARSFKQLVAEDPEFIYSVSRAGQRRLPA